MSETELWLSIGNILQETQQFSYISLGNIFSVHYPTEDMGVWLLESDASNQDWIASNDPETVILDNFTSGLDIWKCVRYEMKRGGSYSLDIENLPTWKNIDTSLEEGYSSIVLETSYQGATHAETLAKKKALHEFHRKHSKPSDNPFYFVLRYYYSVFELFYDTSRNELKYMRVKFKSPPESFIEDRVLYSKMILRSAWSVS